MKKRRKARRSLRPLKICLVSFFMMFAAASGIYCARLYTTPYSSIVDNFAEGTLQEVEISKEKCNILIMGTDKEGLRTDVMMLAQIDPENKKAVVMSIPRDTRVKYLGSNRKITEVHSLGMRNGKHGSEASIIAVKELTGIPVKHFVKVNFEAFNDCIDELGGVDFNVVISTVKGSKVREGYDLVLTGHIHGGQFRLPVVGGLYGPGQGLFPQYDSGVYSNNTADMVVSRGIGNSVFPVRFANRPEVILITLKA